MPEVVMAVQKWYGWDRSGDDMPEVAMAGQKW
jgi:hypothetical protein